MSKLVTYESAGRIAHIQLNRAEKLNALSNQLVLELRDTLEAFQASDDRVAVISAAGEKAFSVGADLKDPPRDPELWECMPGTGVFLDKPIIAAVHGYVCGGAYCLVQFCDLAVADETADFFYPEAQIGFCGGMIASHAGRVPYKLAMEFMLTGKHLDAQRAYEIGTVNKVVSKGQAVEGAMEYARILAESAPLVMSALCRYTRETVLPRGPSENAGLARKQLLRVSRSEDQKEGGKAFGEKRKPNFTGR